MLMQRMGMRMGKSRVHTGLKTKMLQVGWKKAEVGEAGCYC